MAVKISIRHKPPVRTGSHSSVGFASAWYSDGHWFDPPAKPSYVEIGHEIISTAIISLPLIKVGQLSFTGERMCTKYWLTVRTKPAQEKGNGLFCQLSRSP